jgi:hypothetical protein
MVPSPPHYRDNLRKSWYDGTLTFNAFGTVSYDPASSAYTLHSHALGLVGDFRLTPAADGYAWEIPAGPMTIRYTAVVKAGRWDLLAVASAPLLTGSLPFPRADAQTFSDTVPSPVPS